MVWQAIHQLWHILCLNFVRPRDLQPHDLLPQSGAVVAVQSNSSYRLLSEVLSDIISVRRIAFRHASSYCEGTVQKYDQC